MKVINKIHPKEELDKEINELEKVLNKNKKNNTKKWISNKNFRKALYLGIIIWWRVNAA